MVIPEISRVTIFDKNAPSDKINIGQIGCGRIARSHNLPEILKYDNARVIAVSDVDKKRMADGKKFVENYYAKKPEVPILLM